MKPKTGYCINCDNRHGCKSETPPCIAEMREKNITGVAGKQYLVENHKTDKCKDCSFFRSCWKKEEYMKISGEQR